MKYSLAYTFILFDIGMGFSEPLSILFRYEKILAMNTIMNNMDNIDNNEKIMLKGKFFNIGSNAIAGIVTNPIKMII